MAPRPRADSTAVARRLALLSAELTGTPPPDDLPFPDGPPVDLPPPEAGRQERPPPTRVRPGPRPTGAPPLLQLVPTPPAPDPPGERGVPATTSIPAPGRHARRRALGPWASQVALFPGPLAVVAVVVALGVLATGWWLVRSAPEPVAAPRAVAADLATPVAVPGVVAAGAAAVEQEVVVHVAGRVRKPGLYTLQAGARVADALEEAGGARPRVDLSSVNLARPLVDGEQLLVGVATAAAPASPAGPAGGAGLVNLNTADAATLEQLPGVGPVTAASIIAFREEHGGFTSVEQLLDVSGIGEATLAEIAPHATV